MRRPGRKARKRRALQCLRDDLGKRCGYGPGYWLTRGGLWSKIGGRRERVEDGSTFRAWRARRAAVLADIARIRGQVAR